MLISDWSSDVCSSDLIEPDQVTAERVRQELVHVSNDEKLPFLIGLLRGRNPFRSLVFINTKRGAEFVEKGLRLNGFEASVLSGDVSQGQRLRLLEDFKAGKLPVLVATDVRSEEHTSELQSLMR